MITPEYYRRAFVIRNYFFLASFFISNISFSQVNFVYNGSFEDDSSSIANQYNGRYFAGSKLLEGWYCPNASSSDFYNDSLLSLRGNPSPKAIHGSGRVGIILGENSIWNSATDYREYVTGALIWPLEKGKKYHLEFYVCRFKYSHKSPLEIGAYFSTDSVLAPKTKSYLKVTPQVNRKLDKELASHKVWTKVEGDFIAKGGEQFITIGNFAPTIGTHDSPIKTVNHRFTIASTRTYAYYFVDDVKLTEVFPDVITRTKKNLLYLIDVSKSMDQNGNWKSLKKAIQKSLIELPREQAVSLITFSGRPQLLISPTPAGNLNAGKILDSLQTIGSTNAIKSIHFSYEKANLWSDSETEIILCTDGIFHLDEATKKMISSNSAHIRLNVIQVGSKSNTELQEFIVANGGSYDCIENKELEDAFVDLASNKAQTKIKVRYTKSEPEMIVVKYLLAAGLLTLAVISVTKQL